MTAPLDLPDEILREEMPDDDIVLAYIARGALAKYVEGVANENHAFRDELEAAIDGLEEAGETISAAARAWRRPGGVVLPFAPPAARKRPVAILPWSGLAVAAALLLALGGNAYIQDQRETARIQALKDEEIAAQKAQLEKVIAELKAQQEAIASAQSELASAKSDADRMMAQAKLAAAQEQQRKTQSAIQAARPASSRAGAAGAKPACACVAGDPLCACTP